eukprot:scpid68105/ scgid0842/ TRAF-interacting protein
MRISCPVCQEVLTRDFCCAPCGHIFHYDCLAHWLEMKKPSSCPQCRRACPAAKVIRLFVEEHVDVDIDPSMGSEELKGSLKRTLEKVQALEAEVEVLENDLKEVNDRHDKTMIDRQVDQIEISDLRKEANKLKKAADRADMMHQKNLALAEQVRSLTVQLEASESMSTVIEGSVTDVAEVVKQYKNCENSTEALAKFLVSTKKEFERLRASHKDACNMKDRQAKMLAVEKSKVIECQRKLKESHAIRESLEGEVRSLEGEKDVLSARLDKLANKLISMDSGLKSATKRKRPTSVDPGPVSPELIPSQSVSFGPTSPLDDDFEHESSPPPKKPMSKTSSATSVYDQNDPHSKKGSSFRDGVQSSDRVRGDEEDVCPDVLACGKVDSAAALPVKSIDSAHMQALLVKSHTSAQMSTIRKGYNGFGGQSKFHMPVSTLISFSSHLCVHCHLSPGSFWCSPAVAREISFLAMGYA